MRVLVGGGTGFVGTALTQLLKARGHEVTLVSRQPRPGRITWDELARSGLPSCDVAVNLAGENILNPLRRWNEAFQKDVLSSRLKTHIYDVRTLDSPSPGEMWIVMMCTVLLYLANLIKSEYILFSPTFLHKLITRLVHIWYSITTFHTPVFPHLCY
uniref:NAD-dependent epimerase/dehydratase domain-containing protein n=1 Tax=Marmota marmota marmota TaxID=9994 RepID=A0A8C5YXA2_MARMA